VAKTESERAYDMVRFATTNKEMFNLRRHAEQEDPVLRVRVRLAGRLNWQKAAERKRKAREAKHARSKKYFENNEKVTAEVMAARARREVRETEIFIKAVGGDYAL